MTSISSGSVILLRFTFTSSSIKLLEGEIAFRSRTEGRDPSSDSLKAGGGGSDLH